MTRGFAGGLAEGLNQGMQMYALHKSIKSRDAADERAAAADAREQESHALKMREAGEVRNMTEQWAKELGWNPPAARGGSPTNPNAPGFGAPTGADTPSAAGLGGAMPISGTPSNVAGSLRSAIPQPQQSDMSPGEYIQKQVLSGDAFSNPEKLNRMAAIAFANNQGGMGIQFLNQVHTATKTGWTKALGMLASGDGDAAADVLRQNGMDVRGGMTPVEGKEHTWKVNIGGKEREISASDLFMSANPEKAYEMLQAKQIAQRKADLDEREFKLKERKQDNDDLTTKAEVGTLGARAEAYRATARAKDRAPAGGLKASRSSDKSIEQAISRRDKRFDMKATRDGEIDPELRGAYDDATARIQSMIEDETGEELDHRDHHKLTDEMLRFPIDGTPQEKAAATASLLRRFKLDVPTENNASSQLTNNASTHNNAPAKPNPAALAAKKEPTREEKEIDAVRFDAEAVRDLKKLHKERYAVNHTDKDKEELERKIRAIVEKHSSKGALKG